MSITIIKIIEILQIIQKKINLHTIVKITNIVFITLIIWELGSFGALMIQKYVFVTPEQKIFYQPDVKQVLDNPLRWQNFTSIVNLNVFNAKTKQSTQPKKIQISNSTKLNNLLKKLNLKGTILWGKNSFCIIYNTQNRKEETFLIGDMVFDTGLKVNKLEHKKVYLQLGDNIGILEQTTDKNLLDLVFNPKKSTPIKSTTSSKNKSSNNNVIQREGETEFFIPSTVMQKELENFGRLLTQARVVPNIVNKKFDGFIIKSIRKGSIFERLGLKNYDVIKQVNGQVIGQSPESSLTLFKTLKEETEFTLDIIRGDSPLQFQYYIE